MEIKPFEKKVWLSTPTMHGDELKYVTEAYETNWMSTVGQNINEAERIVAEKLGCKYAVGLASGTAALHLCMKLAGIKPGVKVKAVDALITNFHLPQSTLLMLVSTLMGRENALNVYNTAVKERYRFFSFGDAMFIE